PGAWQWLRFTGGANPSGCLSLVCSALTLISVKLWLRPASSPDKVCTVAWARSLGDLITNSLLSAFPSQISRNITVPKEADKVLEIARRSSRLSSMSSSLPDETKKEDSPITNLTVCRNGRLLYL